MKITKKLISFEVNEGRKKEIWLNDNHDDFCVLSFCFTFYFDFFPSNLISIEYYVQINHPWIDNAKNKIRIKSVLHWKNWLNTIESMCISNSFFISLIMIWSLFKEETEKEEEDKGEKKYLENIFTQYL